MMDDLLHQIAGRALPLPPADFRDRVERRTNPILGRRRRVRLVRRVAMAVAAVLILVPLLLVRAPESVQETATDELSRLSTEELLRRREALMGARDATSASLVHIPIETIIESTDVIVQGVVEEATVDREQLIKNLARGVAGSVYVDVQFNVVDSCPPLDQSTIVVRGTAHLQPGTQMLMALNRFGVVYRPVYGFRAQGVYHIVSDGGEPYVEGLAPDLQRVTVPEAWKLIRTYHDRIHGQASLPRNELQQHLATMKYGSLKDAIFAFEVVAGDPNGTASDLLDALQSQYESLFTAARAAKGSDPPSEWPYGQLSDLSRLTLRVLDACYASASEREVEQVLNWCMGHVSSLDPGFQHPHELAEAMLRLALKHPGPARRPRALSILGREVEYFDEGNRRRKTIVVPPGQYALRLIAKTPGEDMEALLNDLFAAPDAYRIADEFDRNDLDKVRAQMFSLRDQYAATEVSSDPEQRLLELMESYAVGDTHPRVRDSILYRMQPGDYTKIQFLQSLPLESVVWAIASKVPDATFVPALRENAEQGSPLAPYLDALSACGGTGQALTIARRSLEKPYPDGDLQPFARDVYARCAALRFLGNTGDQSLASLIRTSITPAKLAGLRETHSRLSSKQPLATEPNKRSLRPSRSSKRNPLEETLRLEALLALTRLGDRSVVPEWEALCNGDDVRKRITAAVALFYLGEEAGSEWIDAFARHAERDAKDVHELMSTEGNYADFQHTIAYLRSPETDALFLERLEYGYGDGDRDLALDVAFLADHADTVLPLLVEHLEHRDWRTRKEAADSLETILGVRVDWDEFALAGTQPEKVQRLTTDAEVLLAGWAPRFE